MGAGVPGVSEDEDVPGHGVKKSQGPELEEFTGLKKIGAKTLPKTGPWGGILHKT